MAIPDTLLGTLSPEDFLRDYWQQRPLLVRGALPGFTSPLAPEELAGLACEDDVTARLILERGGSKPWQMRFGPFDEEDFAGLPETHWTLLVQEVDRFVPEVADLLEAFRFLPNWRIDDVQISYAPPGGNAGAHLDSYDVFLLQGLGHRRWQIGTTPIAPEDEAYVPDLDVRLLADFIPDEEYVLGPGDLLYLPPRLPHYGVALDDCMTYSIGFRAPSQAEVVEGFFTHVLEHFALDARYADPGSAPPEHVGEISRAALGQIGGMLRAVVMEEAALASWFGRFVTEPRRGFYPFSLDEPYTADELAEALDDGARLRRSAVAYFAFAEVADGVRLFVGGEEYPLAAGHAEAAALLTGTAPLTAETLAPHLADAAVRELVTTLVNEGHLMIEEGDG